MVRTINYKKGKKTSLSLFYNNHNLHGNTSPILLSQLRPEGLFSSSHIYLFYYHILTYLKMRKWDSITGLNITKHLPMTKNQPPLLSNKTYYTIFPGKEKKNKSFINIGIVHKAFFKRGHLSTIYEISSFSLLFWYILNFKNMFCSTVCASCLVKKSNLSKKLYIICNIFLLQRKSCALQHFL